MRSLSVVAVRSRGRAWLVVALLLGACGACLTFVALAEAGEYHVYSCRTPAGAIAPTDGWHGSAGQWMYDSDSCASGGSLIAGLNGEVAQSADAPPAVWVFDAPAGTQIAGARLWRASYAHSWEPNAASTVAWLAAPEQSYTAADVFDQCARFGGCTDLGDLGASMAAANLVVVPPGNASGAEHLYANASCGGAAGSYCPATGSEYSALISVYAADVVLAQTAGPSVHAVSGELATAPRVSGNSDLVFDASDPGGGVYEVLFSIDGKTVQSVVPNTSNGRCHNVGQSTDGLAAFLYVQPCPSSESVDVPFDTTRVPDGSHHLIVTVIDAAGISAPGLDREITIANPPPLGQANGTNASAQARLSAGWTGSERAQISSAYGRAHTILGRLTGPDGTPIVGARLDCTATAVYEGAKPVAIACPQTGPDGRFAVRIPSRASSRMIRVAYRAHLGDALAVATRTLSLTVRARLRLTVTPHTSSVGQSIHFTGVLHGAPIPRGGKQLVLEASSGGGWVQFDTLNTNAKGRYRASYRFKFPGPVTYRFRVLCPHEADFPFLAGASNIVAVHER